MKNIRRFRENDFVTFRDSDGKIDRGFITKIIDEGRYYNIKSKKKHHWFIPHSDIVNM